MKELDPVKTKALELAVETYKGRPLGNFSEEKNPIVATAREYAIFIDGSIADNSSKGNPVNTSGRQPGKQK